MLTNYSVLIVIQYAILKILSIVEKKVATGSPKNHPIKIQQLVLFLKTEKLKISLRGKSLYWPNTWVWLWIQKQNYKESLILLAYLEETDQWSLTLRNFEFVY